MESPIKRERVVYRTRKEEHWYKEGNKRKGRCGRAASRWCFFSKSRDGNARISRIDSWRVVIEFGRHPSGMLSFFGFFTHWCAHLSFFFFSLSLSSYHSVIVSHEYTTHLPFRVSSSSLYFCFVCLPISFRSKRSPNNDNFMPHKYRNGSAKSSLQWLCIG